MGSIGSGRGTEGWWALGLGLSLGVLSGCGGDSRPDRTSVIVQPRDPLPARAADLGDEFEPSDCFVEPPEPYAATCGTVRVPESSADGARELGLAVMVLYKRGDPPPPDPVVYLEGGPGGSAIDLALTSPFVFEHILEIRDLVLVDQRGTGFSESDLHCESNLAPDASAEEELKALGDCFEELSDAGHDLASYNTRQSARDLNRVRRALGYSEWNLYGISYGTRLALTIARDFPDSVRSLAIDGVLPPDIDFFAEPPVTFSASLDALGEACAAQSDCREYDDILGKLFAAADRLQETPAQFELESGERFTLDGTLWVRTVFELMYIAEVLPYMPAIIELTSSGDYEFLEELFSALEAQTPVTLGMYLSVVCGEEAPFTSRETIDEAAKDLNPHVVNAINSTGLLDVCALWDVPASPAQENAPVVSDLPVLMTSGFFDPITPRRFADRAAAGLENSYRFVLSDQSHGASVSDCGRELVLGFFDDPTRHPRAGCVDELGDPVFEWGRRAGLSPGRPLLFETARPLPEGLADALADALRERRPGRGLPFSLPGD